jgi:hypothetical protein
MKAILLRRPGGPRALEYVEVPTPVPGEGKSLAVAALGRFALVPHRPRLASVKNSRSMIDPVHISTTKSA